MDSNLNNPNVNNPNMDASRLFKIFVSEDGLRTYHNQVKAALERRVLKRELDNYVKKEDLENMGGSSSSSIIVLSGADFSKKNIGSLSAWGVTYDLKNVTCSNQVTALSKGSSYTANFTYDENSITTYNDTPTIEITMGGIALDITDEAIITYTENGFTLTIPEVTGNLVIMVKLYGAEELGGE